MQFKFAISVAVSFPNNHHHTGLYCATTDATHRYMLPLLFSSLPRNNTPLLLLLLLLQVYTMYVDAFTKLVKLKPPKTIEQQNKMTEDIFYDLLIGYVHGHDCVMVMSHSDES